MSHTNTRAGSAVGRLAGLIEACLPALVTPAPEFVPPRDPITEGEATGFFRSVDAGLFDVREDGMCRPLKMRPSTGYCYPLLIWYARRENKVQVWREWLTHGAAPAILHFDYGFPLNDIALDVDAFDALVYSKRNQPLVAVEVKKTSTELNKMVDQLGVLEGTAFELRFSPPRLTNTEQKFRSLLALRPTYFLAIAPSSTRAFKVIHPADRAVASARLREISRLPAA